MEQNIRKENDRKKAYLRRYQNAKRRQEAIEQEIAELRSDQMAPGSLRQDGIPHGSSSSDLSDYAVRLDELLTELEEQKARALRLRVEIMHAVEAVPDETEALLLRLKYIQGLTWEKVAVQMGYKERAVYKIHGRALRNFKMP